MRILLLVATLLMVSCQYPGLNTWQAHPLSQTERQLLGHAFSPSFIDSLHFYDVQSLSNSRAVAAYVGDGNVLLTRNASALAIAHEVGHAYQNLILGEAITGVGSYKLPFFPATQRADQEQEAQIIMTYCYLMSKNINNKQLSDLKEYMRTYLGL